MRIPADADSQRQLLRGLLNIREPRRIGADFLQIQDEYRSCLELAAENGLESVAFCCISTGEFHFPNQLAAEIAVQTVKEFLKKQTSVKKVIFNVFKDIDKKSTNNCSEPIDTLRQVLNHTDAVVIGAGSGLSTSAGFTYGRGTV